MGRLVTIFLGCAFLGAPCLGQTPSRTFFEERLLDKSPIIVRARFDSDQSCFDVEVGAFQVKRRLRGEADDRILVLGASQLSKQFRDVDRLLFLAREPSGCLYRIVDFIDLVHEADAIEAFVRAFLVTIAEVDPAKRRSGLKQIISDGLGMASEFPRKLGVRELERVARRVPPAYSVEEVAALARFSTTLAGDDLARFTASLDAAENAGLGPLHGAQDAIPRGPKRTQFLKIAGEYLVDSDPERRAGVADQVAFRFGDASVPFLTRLLDDRALRPRAALHLGVLQWKGAAPKILAILKEGPSDPGPFIESLGATGGDEVVPAVGKYLSSADHFDEAALALARIGSPAAKRMLDGILAQLRRDPRQAPRVETLQKVRSKEFLEEDAERRLAAKGRYARE